MSSSISYPTLLRRSLAALAVGAMLVAICYFFVDRAVATFVHTHAINRHAILRWLTYPPAYLESWVPAVLVLVAVRRAWGPLSRAERTLAVACLAVPVVEQFRDSLSFLAGRYWPETWVENNPSWIHDGAYGFHPFHDGRAYQSFPSGHTARTVVFATVFWCAYPRWRWACVLAPLAVAVGLVGMNYHFVGDVVAGAVVAGILGAWLACLFDLLPERK